MVLDTISEFCRTIKSEPIGGRDEEEDDEDAVPRTSRAAKRRTYDDDEDEESKMNGNVESNKRYVHLRLVDDF